MKYLAGLFFVLWSFGAYAMETVPHNDWVKLMDKGDIGFVRPTSPRDTIRWVMSEQKPIVDCNHGEQGTNKDTPNWVAPANLWFCSTNRDVEVFVNKSTDAVAQ